MKNLNVFLLFLCVVFLSQTYAQTGTKQETPPAKTGQNLMFNEVYAGYGALSIFYFTGRMKHSSDYPTQFTRIPYPNGNYINRDPDYENPSSLGTLFLGYQRSLNRVVSMGFLFGFQNFSYTETATETSNLNGTNVTTGHTINNNDVLLSGIARFLFSYVNKPVVRIYSGIGIGITVDFGKANLDGKDYSEKKLWPAGELTLMGIRFGRAFGGFFEFGFGSYGIINAGLSYKFAD